MHRYKECKMLGLHERNHPSKKLRGNNVDSEITAQVGKVTIVIKLCI